MDRNIQIEIKDRIAHLVGNPKIICGNKNYTVTFAFDDEWTGIDVKTLRVSYNNKYSDHVFTGNTVDLPPIVKAIEVYLGVFAGDITSTKVAVRAEPSILCEGGSVADPEPDVYNQIIDLINSREPSQGGSGGIAKETDPTVPAWAKQPNKPSYTAKEVGALPADTEIPEPYALPTASETVKGGVMVGKGLRMNGEVLEVEPDEKFQLIQTITTTEAVSSIVVNAEGYKHINVKLDIAAGTADSAGVFLINDTSMGYAGKMRANGTRRQFGFNLSYRSGRIFIDLCGGANTSSSALFWANEALIYQTAVYGLAAEGIQKIELRMLSGEFPSGTNVEVWGVRAQ